MDKNRITQSVILGLTTLVAAATWAGLKSTLFGNGSWVWPSLGFLILLVFLSLSCLLTNSKEILLTNLIIILVCFFFSFGFKLEYLAAWFAGLLLLILGSFKAISEKKVRIKIQISKILQRGLPFILTCLALVIATAYYFSPLALKGQNEIEMPRFLFDAIAKPIVKNTPLDNDALYQMVNQQINKQSQAYKQYFPLGLAIGFFFALKVIGYVFMWLVILSSWLIFKILVSLGAIKIQEQSVLKEVIEI